MLNVTEFIIGKKVRWFYGPNKYSQPLDQIVYIASEISGNRIKINRKDSLGNFKEGGYINIDELYEI